MSEITIFTMCDEEDHDFVELDDLLKYFEEVYEDHGSPEGQEFLDKLEDLLNEIADNFDCFYTDVGDHHYIFHPVYFSTDNIFEAWKANDGKTDSQ
jgi:hypothetical protein